MKKPFVIPEKFQCGGQEYVVSMVERCENNSVGLSSCCGGYVEIANKFNKDTVQSESCKANTFCHEMVHVILGNMGEEELNNNERFVCSFAGFLTEALTSAEYSDSAVYEKFAKLLQKDDPRIQQ